MRRPSLLHSRRGGEADWCHLRGWAWTCRQTALRAGGTWRDRSQAPASAAPDPEHSDSSRAFQKNEDFRSAHRQEYAFDAPAFKAPRFAPWRLRQPPASPAPAAELYKALCEDRARRSWHGPLICPQNQNDLSVLRSRAAC